MDIARALLTPGYPPGRLASNLLQPGAHGTETMALPFSAFCPEPGTVSGAAELLSKYHLDQAGVGPGSR